MKRSLRAIFSRKWAARVLFASACVATLLAVACVVGNRITRNAWETYQFAPSASTGVDQIRAFGHTHDCWQTL